MTDHTRILVACEESQAVTIELRRLGYEAYSCDLEPCSGGHPEWHIRQDVLPLLNGDCAFQTVDGAKHSIVGKWDMIIAHPPCTYLTVAGNKWFRPEYAERFPTRRKDREDAIKFFMFFTNADCPRIAIENPVGIMSSAYRKPDQIIQPYEYGFPARKSTCLWLKGLPALKPTNIVPYEIDVFPSGNTQSKWHTETGHIADRKERAKVRSKTPIGLARAMAEQWAGDMRIEREEG